MDSQTTEKRQLNAKQEEFCRLYASREEFFGNGTRAYAQAYGIDISDMGRYKGAQVNAGKLLSNTFICDRINELIEDGGLNDQFVDKQLAFLVTQHADHRTKLGAIREYNALKQRVVAKSENRTDVTSNGETVGVVDPTLAAGFADYLKNQSQA